jgi:hypothetical protein
MAAYTHAGCRSHVGHVPSGAKLWTRRIPRAGQRHALNGGPRLFIALCGETVHLERAFNEWGDPAAPNVRPATDPEARAATCRKCLRILARP